MGRITRALQARFDEVTMCVLLGVPFFEDEGRYEVMSENIRVERRGSVEVVFLNRPDVLNALDRATLEELADAFARVASEGTARALVLTGEGRAFAAGADIAEMRSLEPVAAEAFSRLGHETFEALEALPIPTLAAVNGFALGGGCELALACDWIYASEKARFGQPEVALGLKNIGSLYLSMKVLILLDLLFIAWSLLTHPLGGAGSTPVIAVNGR